MLSYRYTDAKCALISFIFSYLWFNLDPSYWPFIKFIDSFETAFSASNEFISDTVLFMFSISFFFFFAISISL